MKQSRRCPKQIKIKLKDKIKPSFFKNKFIKEQRYDYANIRSVEGIMKE